MLFLLKLDLPEYFISIFKLSLIRLPESEFYFLINVENSFYKCDINEINYKKRYYISPHQRAKSIAKKLINLNKIKISKNKQNI